MTVAELIDELKRQPQHLPCKVLLSEVVGVQHTEEGYVDVNDDCVMMLQPSDALEADKVIFEGNYVVIESK